MSDPALKYALLVVWGMFLGAVFFGGLWVTVRQMPRSPHPALLFLSSVVLRTTIVLIGIWYFSAGDAMAMIACLAGFVGLRLLATHGATVFGREIGNREVP